MIVNNKCWFVLWINNGEQIVYVYEEKQGPYFNVQFHKLRL